MRLITSLALAASILAPAAAQESPRMAFFVLDHVVQTSVRAKKVFAEMEVKGKQLQERIQAKAEELKRISKQLESPSLADEGRAKLQRELQDGEVSLKRMQEDSQLEFNKVRDTAFQTFQKEVDPVIRETAKDLKLQVVLNYQPGMLAYGDEAWMLGFSQEVAKRYDAKYESGAAAAPAAKPAAKPAEKPAPKAAPAKK